MSALVVSLDLESYWGVQDKREPDAFPQAPALRQAVHSILDRFRERQVHATWATVGMLMCRDAEDWERMAPPPKLRPAYQDAHRSTYQLASRLEDPKMVNLLFAPDLVRAVRDTPDQEVGTHTFSHYYCAEPGASIETFKADLEAAARVAHRDGITLQSLVFPRNQVLHGFLNSLTQQNIRTFRGNPRNLVWNGLEHRPRSRALRAIRLLDDYLPVLPNRAPPTAKAGYPLDVPATRFLRISNDRRRNDMHLGRIRAEMRSAKQTGTDYHLWWHPHNVATRMDEGLRMIDVVLDVRDKLDLESRSMSEVTASCPFEVEGP